MMLTSTLHGTKKAAIAFGLCIAAFVVYLFLAPMVVWLAGYYPDTPGLQTAQQIIARQRPASDCFKLVHTLPHLLAPTLGEQQALCVYKYAELTKDPSACELLMPSTYGNSCVGAAENHQLPCNTDVKERSVFWTEDNVEHLLSVDECALADAGRSALGDQCCQVAKVAFLQEENDCSNLAGSPPVHDRCLYALALKLKRSDACQDIQNENARAACLVRTGYRTE